MKNRLCILSVLLVVGALQGVSGLIIDTRTPNVHQSHKLKHSVNLSPPVGVIRHKLRLEMEY